MQSALQSVVGLGSRDTPVGSIEAVREEVAVWVGVIVGLVVGKGVMLDRAVEAGGCSVQVGGNTTLVPAGTGLLVGGGANIFTEAQPVNVIRINATKIQNIDPCWMRN